MARKKRKVRYTRLSRLERRRATGAEEKKNWSVADKWSPLLAATNHVPVVNAFLDYYHQLGGDEGHPKPLTSAQAIFIIHLMSYKWDQDHPFPSYTELARAMGLKTDSVRKISRDLEKMDLLERQERYRDPDRKEGHLSPSFNLSPLFARLERLIRRDHPDLATAVDDEATQSAEEASPTDSSAHSELAVDQPSEALPTNSPRLRPEPQPEAGFLDRLFRR